jgi:hypothetical protein
VEERCEKERNTEHLKRLNRRIRENEAATANLVKALEAGKAADVISAQIEKRQQEKADLEAQLARERMQAPLLKYEQVKFFYERFIGLDTGDISHRRAIVDILIRRVELHDDHMTIYYNAQDGQREIPIGDGSPMGTVVEISGQHFNHFRPLPAV